MIDTSHKIFYFPEHPLAFTLNASDKFQYFGDSDRLNKGVRFYSQRLKDALDPYAKYVAYLELSEPHGNLDVKTMGPRLHVHGVFILRNEIMTRQFLLHGLPRLKEECKVDIDTIKDASVWAFYCTKQQHIMQTAPLYNHESMLVPIGTSDFEEAYGEYDVIKKKKDKASSKLPPAGQGFAKLSPKATSQHSPEIFFMD